MMKLLIVVIVSSTCDVRTEYYFVFTKALIKLNKYDKH